ncbi:MAG TPA: hypothetical protein V6C89_15590 [Drouetiella sp.]
MLEKQLPQELHQERIDLKIGELLVAADVLSKDDLEEAIKTSKKAGLPVGRVLIMAGFCSETEFQGALNAQSLIRDKIVAPGLAIKALNLVTMQSITFDEALREVGWAPKEDQESNRLGELLLAAEILPATQLDTAMRTSKATGLPLGRLLVSLGILSDEILATALNAQILIRAGRVSREQAINGLRSSYKRMAPFELTLSDQGFYRGPYRPTIRLGELLVSAGLISEDDVLASLEASLKQEKSVGKILVENKFVTVKLLNLALSLQEMVSNETVTPKQAAVVLHTLNTTDRSLDDILAFLEVPVGEVKTNVRFHDILRVAGLLEQADVERIKLDEGVASSADAFKSARILLDTNLIDKRTFLGALRCYYLILGGWLNMQQGIIALNYFHHQSCSFDEVLHELKWTVRTHTKEPESD